MYNFNFTTKTILSLLFIFVLGNLMKEVYWEIKINKPGPRFLPELSLSGPAKVVYFDLPIYFLHGVDSVMKGKYFWSIDGIDL